MSVLTLSGFCVLITLFSQAGDAGTLRPIDLTFAPDTAHSLDVGRKGDFWELKITDHDPYVFFKESGFVAQRSDVIEIRYRTKESFTSQIYWTRVENAEFIEYNFSLRPTETPGTGLLEWVTYELPIGQLSKDWTETIKSFRFDPAWHESSGQMDIAWFRIVSRHGENLRQANLAPAKPGEFVSDVLSGIDPGRGVRYLENQHFRVETERADLCLFGINEDRVSEPLASISVEFDETANSAAFSTSNFPSDYLFCKFHDRWKTQALSLFYQSPQRAEAKIDARIDAILEAGQAPYLKLSSSGSLILTPSQRLKEVILPGNTSISAPKDGDSPLTRRLKAQRIALIVQNGPPIILQFENDTERDVTVYDTRISVYLSEEEMVMLTADAISAHSPTVRFRKPQSYRMVAPQTVTLVAGITVVDATLEVYQHSESKGEVVQSPVAFRTIVSSDFIDVNLPVEVGQTRIEIPVGANVLEVRDAITNEGIAYWSEGSYVVLSKMPARTVRVKCDRLLDYRVMFNGPRPIDGGHFHEDFSNYYYPQWMFFWEPVINRMDVLDWLDNAMRDRPLPVFLGLHYGSHAPPNYYDTLYKIYPDIKQVDNHGNPHKGLAEGSVTPPWMCLVHPTLWQEIRQRLDGIFEVVQSKPWYERIFGYSSTSEPWIVTGDNDPETIYCYNPEHIKWFQQFEKSKWNDDLESFNRTFETSFASWDEVEPPRKLEESAYYNEWLLSKLEAVVASEEFYRGEIFKRDPKRPNYAHMAIMVCYNQIGNSNTPDVMHVGKDTNPEMFKEGGSLYSSDPAIQALVSDSIRAYDTDEVSFPECHGTNYNQMYAYFVGESGLFKKSFNMMVPGTSWFGGLQVGSAWQVFSEMMNFLCVDLGEVARPKIGLVYDLISDNFGVMSIAHGALFERNVDRCVITTRMIERGYLAKHPLEMLILPDVRMLSEQALSELSNAVEKGLNIVILGQFAESDYYYRTGREFAEARERLLKQALRPKNAGEVAETLPPALKTDMPEKMVIYRKSRGFTLYNMWADKTITIETPKDMRSGRLAVVSDTGQVIQIRQKRDTIKVPLEGMRACSVVSTIQH